MTRLDGRVAIVSGGGSGLGREIALEYAALGASVVVSSNVEAEIEAVAAECRQAGGEAIAVAADVRSETEMQALIAHAVEAYGGLDVFVAAAAVDIVDVPGPEGRYFRRLSLEQWTSVIETNVTGVFVAFRAAIEPMIERGGGSLMSFSSGTVRFPPPGLSAYVSSKFALEGLTKVLAQELAADGIRVNTIQPGGVTDTAFLPDWVRESPPGPMHQPSVIRALAAYLASDESRLITGRSLVACEFNKERGLELCPCARCTTTDPALALEWRGATAL